MAIEFAEYMTSFELVPPDHIPAGEWIRFPGVGKGANNKSAWAFLFPDRQGGVFGDYSSGLDSQIWQAERVKDYSPERAADFKALVESARAEEMERRDEAHERASKRAESELATLDVATNKHPYLRNKHVKSYDLLAREGLLFMPLYTREGKLTSYQTITPKGTKKLMTGGRKKGCFFTISGVKNRCYIVEGYATGATVHEATGATVLIAVDAGNLMPVAEGALKSGYQTIIIAADNDHDKGVNVGIKSAKAVCEAYPKITYIAPPMRKDHESTDWNDHAEEHGLLSTKRRLMVKKKKVFTPKDIVKLGSKETLIPEELYKGRGLIESGLSAVHDLSAINILQYNFPIVITLLASVLAGKIRVGHVHPSCFFVKVGGTSTGKTDIDKYSRASIFPHFNETLSTNDGKIEIRNSLYGVNDFASGTGLLRAIQKQPRSLITLDEISYLFMRHPGAYDPNALGKTKAILELSTSAGMRFERPYSDNANTIAIEYPIVNLIGNATPEIFKSFTHEDFHTGLIQRFDFFCYDGKVLKRDGKIPSETDASTAFTDALKALFNVKKPEKRYDLVLDVAVDIGLDDEAVKKLSDYSDKITDELNAEEDDGVKGIISRRYNAAVKFALIHVGATRSPKDIFEPVTSEDLAFGIALADILANWKLKVLAPNVHAGEFDTLCRAFLEGAKSAVVRGRKPTGAVIVNCRPRLKNLRPREWDDIVKVLKAQGLINITEDGKTIYEPLVEDEE